MSEIVLAQAILQQMVTYIKDIVIVAILSVLPLQEVQLYPQVHVLY